MPIYLRNFYMRKLIDVKEEEQKQIKKSQKKPSKTPGPNIVRKS